MRVRASDIDVHIYRVFIHKLFMKFKRMCVGICPALNDGEFTDLICSHPYSLPDSTESFDWTQRLSVVSRFICAHRYATDA